MYTKNTIDNIGNGINVHELQERINSITDETMKLIAENDITVELQIKLEAMSDETKRIQQIIEEHKNDANEETVTRKMDEITELLEQGQDDEDVYNDDLVRQLIETIKVVNEDTLLIKYHCGYEHNQRIDIKIKKIKKIAIAKAS